ncbi:MAG: hypothetical protein ACKOEC_20880 [Acidimicrobiia bacterium]
MTCAQCGSINIVRRRSTTIDKIVRLFTNRKRVICRRCGWTARIRWDHDDNYIPAMAELRVSDPSPQKSKTDAKFEDDFDINRFH